MNACGYFELGQRFYSSETFEIILTIFPILNVYFLFYIQKSTHTISMTSPQAERIKLFDHLPPDLHRTSVIPPSNLKSGEQLITHLEPIRRPCVQFMTKRRIGRRISGRHSPTKNIAI